MIVFRSWPKFFWFFSNLLRHLCPLVVFDAQKFVCTEVEWTEYLFPGESSAFVTPKETNVYSLYCFSPSFPADFHATIFTINSETEMFEFYFLSMGEDETIVVGPCTIFNATCYFVDVNNNSLTTPNPPTQAITKGLYSQWYFSQIPDHICDQFGDKKFFTNCCTFPGPQITLTSTSLQLTATSVSFDLVRNSGSAFKTNLELLDGSTGVKVKQEEILGSQIDSSGGTIAVSFSSLSEETSYETTIVNFCDNLDLSTDTISFLNFTSTFHAIFHSSVELLK